jgi:hypothetical protein
MATQRYQHLKKRVSSKDAAFYSSVATKNKESKELEVAKKLEEWKNINK